MYKRVEKMIKILFKNVCITAWILIREKKLQDVFLSGQKLSRPAYSWG